MGGRLSKLKESKLKNPVHVEIHDEEEKEEWDEKDKVDYERTSNLRSSPWIPWL